MLQTRFSLQQNSPEPKVKVLISMYEPLEVSKCKKCGKVLAEPKELIRIRKVDITREGNRKKEEK